MIDVKEYKHNYYVNNKDKYYESNKRNKPGYELMTCKVCDKEIQKKNLSRHLKSKYHLTIESGERLEGEKKRCEICKYEVLIVSYKSHLLSNRHIRNIN